MRAGYGKKLRQFLGEQTTLETIIDFGDLPVFEATAYPSILIARKLYPLTDWQVETLTIDEIEILERLEVEAPQQAWRTLQTALHPTGWTLERPVAFKLMQKLKDAGRTLNDMVKGHIYRGVTSGFNEAFVIDETIKQQLIAEDPLNTEIIKHWLRGRDIKRWQINSNNLYLIFARRGIDIDRYPSIQNYLRQFKDRLTPGVSGGRKPGNYKWYEIQDITAYYPEFEKPKIIWPDIAKRCEFVIDGSNSYADTTIFMTPHGDNLLLAILNSSVTDWFMHQISSSIQHGFLRFKRVYTSQIPIPDAPPAERQAIEKLVRRLLDLRGEGAEVAGLEEELNERVYRLFGLTAEEIRLVEG